MPIILITIIDICSHWFTYLFVATPPQIKLNTISFSRAIGERVLHLVMLAKQAFESFATARRIAPEFEASERQPVHTRLARTAILDERERPRVRTARVSVPSLSVAGSSVSDRCVRVFASGSRRARPARRDPDTEAYQ